MLLLFWLNVLKLNRLTELKSDYKNLQEKGNDVFCDDTSSRGYLGLPE